MHVTIPASIRFLGRIFSEKIFGIVCVGYLNLAIVTIPQTLSLAITSRIVL